MKDKNVAAILAIFTGTFGIHRFYLGQVGLGVLYCVFSFSLIPTILGLIDAVALLTMDKERFDYKYNRDFFERTRSGRYDQESDRRYDEFDQRRENMREQRRQEREERYERRRREREERYQRRRRDSDRTVRPEYRRPEATPRETRRQAPRRPVKPTPPPNMHKRNGIRLFKDFDYERAIEEFNKALQLEPQDVASHFNLACAYSLTEQKEKALFHLDKAVTHGFVDFDKLNTHDALAYVRIQDEWDTFVENGYRMIKAVEPSVPTIEKEEPKEETKPAIDTNADLLEQIKQLGELREKGWLTEEEFAEQKRRLLG